MPYRKSGYKQLIHKNPRSSEEEPSKELKTPDLGAKPHVWHDWRNNFESTKSTKKVTQLIEQVNVM